jgi:hypothetical protein
MKKLLIAIGAALLLATGAATGAAISGIGETVTLWSGQ